MHIDAGLVQLGQSAFTHVGISAVISFTASLVSPGDTGQFLDVNSGKAIFLYHALRHQNGVF